MKLPKFSKKWKWLAMDEDKQWTVFSTKPKKDFRPTIIGFWNEGKGECFEIFYVFEPVKDWKKSLIRINK